MRENRNKVEFCEQHQSVLSDDPKHNLLILMGDMNANIGKRASTNIIALGNEACDDMNQGENLYDFL